MKKRILIINGSPHGAKGNTEILVSAFVAGAETAGASVARLYTKNLRISPCCGTFYCWEKNPGVCCRKGDDMQKVLNAMNEADVLVLASPVYVDGMTGPLKNLLDRCLVRSTPYQVNIAGHSRHNANTFTNVKSIKQLLLISNCGFHELDNFDAMLAHVKAIAKNYKCEFVGALLRPHGPALSILLDKMPKKMPIRSRALEVLAAARRAGRELVEAGRISEETAKGVSKELLTIGQYKAMVNTHFAIERGKIKLKSFFNPPEKSSSPVPISA